VIRARFFTNGEDYRPVKFPPPHPYWCTGYTIDDEDSQAIVVAYADSEEQILEYWPDAENIDSEPAEAYVFTNRFQKPAWFISDAE
jgi:hypothetical protein